MLTVCDDAQSLPLGGVDWDFPYTEEDISPTCLVLLESFKIRFKEIGFYVINWILNVKKIKSMSYSSQGSHKYIY